MSTDKKPEKFVSERKKAIAMVSLLKKNLNFAVFGEPEIDESI